MAELLGVPDVETAACVWLRAELAVRGQAAHVATSVPADRPDRLVVVTLTNGNTRNLIMRDPMLLVECWAPDDTAAFQLAQLTHALLWSLPGQTIHRVQVYRVEDGGLPVRFPDPDTRNPRYQFTAALTVRAQSL